MTRPSRFPVYLSPEDMGCLRATLVTRIDEARRLRASEYEQQLIGVLKTLQEAMREAYGRDV